MKTEQWHQEHALTLFFPEKKGSRPGESQHSQHDLVAVAIMLNAAAEHRDFHLPEITPAGRWNLEFHSSETTPQHHGPGVWGLASRSMACALYTRD